MRAKERTEKGGETAVEKHEKSERESEKELDNGADQPVEMGQFCALEKSTRRFSKCKREPRSEERIIKLDSSCIHIAGITMKSLIK